MAKKLFKEKQQFKSIEIIALVVLTMVGVAYKMVSELLQPSADFGFTISLCVVLLVLLGYTLKYFYELRLKITVNAKHISFSMPPFKRRKEKIKWEDVIDCEIIETPLINQWHGGNISFNREKRYSFNGRNGVRITTKNGSEYFIGSNKLNNLKEAIYKALGK